MNIVFIKISTVSIYARLLSDSFLLHVSVKIITEFNFIFHHNVNIYSQAVVENKNYNERLSI